MGHAHAPSADIACRHTWAYTHLICGMVGAGGMSRSARAAQAACRVRLC